mgnify:CR=1 FL=1
MTILGCGAEMKALMAVSDEDVQTIEDVLKERLDMGIARPEAQRQAVAEAIAMLGTERAMVMGAISIKVEALPKAANSTTATHQDPGAAPEVAQRLCESVVVEQVEVTRVRIAAPHRVDSRHRTRLPLFARHDAETTSQTTSAREKPDARSEARV